MVLTSIVFYIIYNSIISPEFNTQMQFLKKSKIINTLWELGLSKNQIKIYIQLLSIGTSQASILWKNTKIPRSTVKYTCDSLINIWLIDVLPWNNTVYYTAKKPENIFNIIDRKYSSIDKLLNNTKDIMEDLQGLIQPHTPELKIKYYNWIMWVKELMLDSITEWKPLYGIMDFWSTIHKDIIDFSNNYFIPEKIKNNITSYIILENSIMNREWRKNDKDENRISLLLDKNDFPFNSCVQIYGNKVAFISYSNSNIISIIIEDTFIVKALFKIFKLAWSLTKKLPENKIYSNTSL